MYCLIYAQARGIFWFKYLNYIIIYFFFFIYLFIFYLFFLGGGGLEILIVWGYEDFVDIFIFFLFIFFFFGGGVTTKLDRMRIFLRGKNFKYFLGCLIFPIFFCGKR